MDFLLETLINIEYFIYFLCIGESYLCFNRRYLKYEKILLLLVAIVVSILWRYIGVWQRAVIHALGIVIVIKVYFQERWARMWALYFSIMTLLAMLIPMFELLIESILYFCNLDLTNNVIRFLAYTLLLVYLWVIGKFFEKKFPIGISRIEKGYLIFIIIIICMDSVVVSLLGNFIRLNEQMSEKLTFTLVYIFIVIGILMQLALLIYAVITRTISKENELLAKQFLDSQKDHYEYLEKRETETKRFRHDIKNHLIVMTELLHNKDFGEIEKYLNAINENVNKFSNRISVNNGIADAIINKFYYDAQEHGIHIQVRGHFPVECYISAYDICTILSNLLSNAITAVTQCERRKEILVDIRYTEQEIIIAVENDYEHELKIKDSRFISTKADAYSHGFGLENVKACVERNDGYLSISTENHRFKVMLSIRNAKEEDDENSSCRR